ncbi:hypothetical protein ACFWWT_30375 [Streptomyces sp. NPDC058676]|uniref:hypothetical protein n=1 Tax=unclassified Streptomyces TaxID=2593676 RepID=UPI0036639B49
MSRGVGQIARYDSFAGVERRVPCPLLTVAGSAGRDRRAVEAQHHRRHGRPPAKGRAA